MLTAGLGTGATMAGVTAALRTWFRQVRQVAVQPAGCDLLAGLYEEHGLQGIAVGQAPPFIDVHGLDAIVSVSGGAASDAERLLARRFRFHVRPSSAANFAAVEQARQLPQFRNVSNCLHVTFLYDRGEDYE